VLVADSGAKAVEVRRTEGEGWVLVGADEYGWIGLTSLGAALRASGGRLPVRTDAGIEVV